MKFDLHCHSSASDGKLPPQDVLKRADEAGLGLFALTDHDTVAGYQAVCQSSADFGFDFVSGIELSSQWLGAGIHIVGLDFDVNAASIQAAISHQRIVREQRAHTIDQVLAKHNMPGVLQGALVYCADLGQIGRPHFAQAMVDKGYVVSKKRAFDQWLGTGKVGDIKNGWPSIEQAVQWIVDAQGVAVLAHPLRYKMTFTKLKRLMHHFSDAGGQAIEVVGQQANMQTKKRLVTVAAELGLAASGGADFHDPEWAWAQIGQIDPLPTTLPPVWQCFNRTAIKQPQHNS